MAIKNASFGIMLFAFCATLSGCHHGDLKQHQGYIEGRFTYISSQVTGTLKTLPIERGDAIQKNDILFTLDKNPQSAAVNQAEAALQQAKATLANLEKGKRPTEIAAIEAQQKQLDAQLIYAKKMVDRYHDLSKKSLIEKATYDKALADYDKLNAQLDEVNENLKTAQLQARPDKINAANANVQAAQSALKQAQWQLNQKTIRSPIMAEVYDLYYRVGENVPADHPVVSLLNVTNIFAIFYVPEEQLAQVKTGQKISMSCDSCKTPITGTIYFISPQAEYTPPIIYSESSRNKLVYRVEAKLAANDAELLHPGQPIEVTYGAGN